MDILITRLLVKYLEEQAKGTLILEPRFTFNKAIIGYHPPSDRLIYSMSKLIKVYSDDMLDCDEESIIEYIYYNICFGEKTPIVFDDRCEMEEGDEDFHSEVYDLKEGEAITQFLGIHHIADLRYSKAEYSIGRIPNCS